MSATGAGYDYSVSTFSPNGRVFQVEYAGKAVEKSGTAIGIRCKDGVAMGVEIPVLRLVADARQLVNKAREEASQYYNLYGELIPSNVLNDRLSMHVHMHTLYWYLRPFGCAILLAVYDDHGPALYSIAPNGESYKYYATAIGKNKQGASSELESIKWNEITAKEGIRHIARILYKLHDESKDKEVEIELSYITDETQRRHVLVPAELRDEATAYAKAEKERTEQGEEDEEER